MPTPIKLPQGMGYGWWHFAKQRLQDLIFDVELVAGDERSPMRYYQLYNGHIGGIQFYFGFQTDVRYPKEGRKGKGLIFSRWKTRKDSDAAPVPGGWIENADHEGGFVGVRSRFEWTLGRYECGLTPVREEDAATWYEFRVRRLADGEEASTGSLRFPYVDGQRPLIHSGGGSWIEVYGKGCLVAEDVPLSHMNVSVRADGGSLAPESCQTRYNNEFPPADVDVAPGGVLMIRSGHGVQRVHPELRRLIGGR